jgi:putative nucleotide binding protein
MGKEDNVIILEYLPNGYPLEGKHMPLAQAVGTTNLTLLELVPRKGVSLEAGEEVYIGEGKRDKIYYILGRLQKAKLTEAAKKHLIEFVEGIVKQREKEFVEFFNKAEAINKRIHQLELLPGLGKKYMTEILKQRQEKEFDSYDDIRNRVSNLPFPEKIIEKRVMQELTEEVRYGLFVK